MLCDVPDDPVGAGQPGGPLGLFEHCLYAVEILWPAARDQRARPAGVGTGQEQRRAEPLVYTRGRGEVLLGLLVALEGRGESAERPRNRAI